MLVSQADRTDEILKQNSSSNHLPNLSIRKKNINYNKERGNIKLNLIHIIERKIMVIYCG